MVEAYNFLASWQLFPEKCVFENGMAPKSGNYIIESSEQSNSLNIRINWVSLENEAFYSQYYIVPDNQLHDFENRELADEYQASILNSSIIETTFFKNSIKVLQVTHEILSNGFMKITQQGLAKDGSSFTNVEIYHKQLSVLPYASSAAGVAIRPTKQGSIKHKALAAMEEQTNMQLDQIRQQIELLAKQAQEIKKRKELSAIIYDAHIGFKPQIGQIYHLYEGRDGKYTLSLVAPTEWGGSSPFKQHISSVLMLADNTWKEV